MEKSGASEMNNTENAENQRSEDVKSAKASSESPTANKTRKKKTLHRGNAFHGDENSETRDDVDFIYVDNNIFPSPVAITQEEALRETCCHVTRQNSRQQLLSAPATNNHETSEDSQHSVMNGISADTGSLSRRKEVEKPPRLQKQASRDRICASYNKQSTCTEHNNGHVNDTLHKESNTECLDSMGVDVHEFLVKALQSNPRDRSILLKLEHDMIKFVNSKQIEFMRFPEMTSYHRMLVHRVAAYFGMDHNIDAKGTSVIINKTKHTRLPDTKFSEHILTANELNAAQEDMRRRSILKRMQNCQSLDHSNSVDKGAVNKLVREDWKARKQRSFEERENNYEKIRARIFNNQVLDEPHLQKEPRSRDKERVLAQWKKRPWNSTDLGSLPGQHQTSAPMPDSNLTAKSSSFSGITVLSNNNDGGSLSSSTSSVFVEQHQNDSTPDEWNNVSNQQSTHSDKPAYPNIGNPYVNAEGFPILYPCEAANFPAYQTQHVPMQYRHQVQSYNAPQHAVPPYRVISSPADTKESLSQQSPSGNGVQVHHQRVSCESNTANSSKSTRVHAVYHPTVYQPYQHAPVQLVYYPTPPAQQMMLSNKVGAGKPGENGAHEATDAMHSLHLDKGQVENMEKYSSMARQDGAHTTLSESSDPSKQLHHNTNEPVAKSAVFTAPSQSSTDTKRCTHDQEQKSPNIVTTVHTTPGSVTYFTTDGEANSAKPQVMPSYRAGATSYPSAMQQAASTNAVTQTTPGHPSEFYPQQGVCGVVNYNYATPSPQPVYYVLPNNAMQAYQNFHPHPLQSPLCYNPSAVYSPVPQSYVHPSLPAQSPYHFQNVAFSGGAKPTAESDAVANSNQSANCAKSLEQDGGDGIYPMAVTNHTTGIDCPRLNKFAADHRAKIVRFGSSKGDQGEKDDIYLLFPSLEVATSAAKDLQTESSASPSSRTFNLDHVHDANLLDDVITQVRELDCPKR